MSKLFGFSIGDESDDKSKSLVAPVPPNNDDGVDHYVQSGFYGSYVDLEGVYRTEFELIKRYREMALHPECDNAIEDVVNFILNLIININNFRISLAKNPFSNIFC